MVHVVSSKKIKLDNSLNDGFESNIYKDVTEYIEDHRFYAQDEFYTKVENKKGEKMLVQRSPEETEYLSRMKREAKKRLKTHYSVDGAYSLYHDRSSPIL